MRRTIFALWALSLAAGCRDYAGPSGSPSIYALARVGAAHLPISFNGDGTAPFLVADTLRLLADRPRTDSQILRQIRVMQQELNGPDTRSEVEYGYDINNGVLTYTDCPIGALCAALVYRPIAFQIVDDSLFEITPPGAAIPPRVYGLVRYR
jgi:hypothetical protein